MKWLVPLSFASIAAAGPIIGRGGPNNIPGKYIVVMSDYANETALQKALNHATDENGDGVDHVFRVGGFSGFAGSLNSSQLAKLATHSAIDRIEPDQIIHSQIVVPSASSLRASAASAVKSSASAAKSSVPAAPAAPTIPSSSPINNLMIQTPAQSWGLSRISHSPKTINYNNFGKNGLSYLFDDSQGTGTCAYVLDTGIDTTSTDEFGNRAKFLKNFVDDPTNPPSTYKLDDNGHGTHVAGTIGSNSFGIAKNITLYAIKILDVNGSGSISGAIAGINYAATDAATARTKGRCPKGTVGNLSLGTTYSAILNQAVASAVNSGLFLAVAAGNNGTNAGAWSPGSEPTACTVGAFDENNQRADFSNWGSVVKIWAPGVDITSVWPNGYEAIASGTSMASPHVAGLAAYFFGGSWVPSKYKTSTQMCSYIRTVGRTGIVTDPTGKIGSSPIMAFNQDGF